MPDPDKPQQIVDAAVRVFARNGYYNSRVSDIAREAGIASGTIYLYFKTKDEILVTLFREKMATKMLFGAMDQLATSWVLGKRGYRLTDAAEAVAAIFLKGVAAHAV